MMVHIIVMYVLHVGICGSILNEDYVLHFTISLTSKILLKDVTTWQGVIKKYIIYLCLDHI